MLGKVTFNFENKIVRHLIFIGEIEHAYRPTLITIKAVDDVI